MAPWIGLDATAVFLTTSAPPIQRRDGRRDDHAGPSQTTHLIGKCNVNLPLRVDSVLHWRGWSEHEDHRNQEQKPLSKTTLIFVFDEALPK